MEVDRSGEAVRVGTEQEHHVISSYAKMSVTTCSSMAHTRLRRLINRPLS